MEKGPSSCKAPHGRTTAENTGTGNQALHQGDGPQNIAIGEKSLQHNYHAQTLYNFNICSDSQIDELFGGQIGREPTRTTIINWLLYYSKLDFLGQYRMLLSQLVPGTGQWVLECDTFKQWKDPSCPERYLWMHGILGAGKTMLSTMIVDTLSRESHVDGVLAVVYLYFEDKNTELTAQNILINIIKQLVQQQPTEGIAPLLSEAYQQSCRNRIPPDHADYLRLLKAVTSLFRAVHLVVDSLDCLPDEEVTHGMIDILNGLPNNVNVLVTSRTGWLTGKELGHWKDLAVVPYKGDIQKYVKSRIHKDEILRRELSKEEGSALEIHIVDMVISASEGMFLLTKLHMDYVSEQGSLASVRTALQDLPKSKNMTFDASIQQIMARDKAARTCMRGLSMHALAWVIHAKRLPTAHEVKESFAAQHSRTNLNTKYIPDEIDWTFLCGGFIVMDPATQNLRLVHESVGAYLLERQFVSQSHDLDMAMTCLHYLLLGTSSPTTRETECGRSLFEYAASHWASHFTSGMKVVGDGSMARRDRMLKMARQFLGSGQKLEDSFRALSPSAHKSAFVGMTGLHAAAYFGNRLLADFLFAEDRVDINSTCRDGQTALHWAVQYQQYDMVELFLKNMSADPNKQDKKQDTPLHLAVVWSTGVSDTTVRMLVRHKARLNLRGSKNQTPLSWAIRYGPRSTAKILLGSLGRDDVNGLRFEGWTVLRHILAFSPDDLELIDDVLAKGADLNTPDADDGWTPLRHAVQNGQEAVARRLLSRQPNPADVTLRDPQTSNSALMWALYHKSPRMADLLIDQGAPVNEVFPDGSSPLIKAIQTEYADTVCKLVCAGADLNHRDLDGRTALHYAVESRDRSVAWLLVTHGADLEARDKKGNTVLEWALEGNEWALKGNDVALAWLLCEHGATIDSDPGRLPMLHRTAGRGLVAAVQFLLGRGVGSNAKDFTGMTALHHAVLERKFDVVRVLGEAGVDLNVGDARGATALHYAVVRRTGRRRALDLLFELGASLETMDGQGRTPLMLAAELATDAATVKIVQRLLDKGADVGKMNARGLSAWSYAEGSDREEARRVLEMAISKAGSG